MKETRTLRLRTERLAELSADEMGGMAGGSHIGCVAVTGTCTHAAACDPTQTILPFRSCIGFCATDPRFCTTQ